MRTLPVAAYRLRLLAGAATTAVVAATLIIGPLAPPSSAADYTVDSEAAWRAALVAAMANTGETNTITLTSDFTMSDPTGTWPEYTLVNHDLIIDGGGHTVTSAAGNAAMFLEAYSAGGSVTLRNITLDGFTLSHAVGINVTGDVSVEGVTIVNTESDTSAMYLYGYHVTVSGSTFSSNTSDGDGGALNAQCGSSLVIVDSTFAGNVSPSSGGALVTSCDLIVTDSTFTNNSAGNSGAAIYSSTDVYLENSNFTGNAAQGNGGAVFSDGDVDTYLATFVDNHAEYYGGAIWASYGAYLDHTTVRGSSAGNDGGGVYVSDGGFGAASSVFEDNTAGGTGGGAYAYDWATSDSSTWSGNEAYNGGGIFSDNVYNSTWIEDSTFVGNVASNVGGAVFVLQGWAQASNSVFNANEATVVGAHIFAWEESIETYATVFRGAVGSDGCYADFGVWSLGYNFDDDGTCTEGWDGYGDFGDLGEDPMLGPLADNGGPTPTHHPLPGSPLIDAIPWSVCVDYSATEDQRGVDRAGAGGTDMGCDIGSVEVIPDLSFPIAGASGTTTVTVSGALGYDCDAWTTIAGYVPAPPAGLSFPHGAFTYCFYVPADGWTVTVTLDLPSPVTELWKETDGTWAQVPGAVFAGTTITYDVTDGGALDDDGVANSYIIDPVAGARRAGFTG